MDNESPPLRGSGKANAYLKARIKGLKEGQDKMNKQLTGISRDLRGIDTRLVRVETTISEDQLRRDRRVALWMVVVGVVTAIAGIVGAFSSLGWLG